MMNIKPPNIPCEKCGGNNDSWFRVCLKCREEESTEQQVLSAASAGYKEPAEELTNEEIDVLKKVGIEVKQYWAILHVSKMPMIICDNKTLAEQINKEFQLEIIPYALQIKR